MACIFKRGKTWSYSVDIGRDNDGKRKKKGKGGFRTQKEAKEAAAIMEAEMANGAFVDEKKITFGELADQWFEEHSKDIKPTTQQIYQFGIKKLKLFFDNVPAKNITKVNYQKVLTELFEANLSQSALRSIHLCANMIFNYACRFDILKNNPVQYTKIPRSKVSLADLENEKDLPKYLEKNELQLFLETVKKHDTSNHYAMFSTLAYTGMRRGELSALKWNDIDFTNKTINITKNVFIPGSVKDYILQTPKTKQSKRTISVSDNILSTLSKLRTAQKQEQMRHRDEWHDENFVFLAQNSYGYPISPRTIWTVMRKNLKRSGLSISLSPHSLRHTHTSLLAEAGVSLEAIMERLGHANDTITRTIYLHVTKETKKDAAQKFYELMNGVSG